MNEERRLSAIDFLVNVIKEHEKALDALEVKLEKLVENLTKAKKPMEAALAAPLIIRCKQWSEFKEACTGCDMVIFKVEGAFTVYCLNGARVITYSEAFPSSLACGLKVKVRMELDRAKVKEWLSRELKVEKSKIIEGEIYRKRNGKSASSFLK